MVPRIATVFFLAALGLSIESAHAGPCSAKIAQFELAVRQSAGKPNAGPFGPQSICAPIDCEANGPASQWHDVIADPTLGDAILDHIIHNAHRIELKGDSLRRRAGEKKAA